MNTRHLLNGILLTSPLAFTALAPVPALATGSWPSSVCVAADPNSTTTTLPCSSAHKVTVYREALSVSGLSDYGAALVAIPVDPTPSLPNTLVVFLPGTDNDSTPPADHNVPYYSHWIERAAYDGVAAAISLPYINDKLTGDVCGSSAGYSTTKRDEIDACYTNVRGEQVYGQNTAYSSGQPTYSVGTTLGSVSWTHVDATNSVVNRLVLWLDYLSQNPPTGTTASYWNQFLADDSSGQSPYHRNDANQTATYPVWSKIILAGHSQGGAVAGFAASTLPSAVQRTLLFSSPQDSFNYSGSTRSVSWILNADPTRVANFWGLRHGQTSTSSDEGSYGDFEHDNWNNFATNNSGSGMTGSDTVHSDSCLANGGTTSSPTMSSCSPAPTIETTTHRYVIAYPSQPTAYPNLNVHDSTAVDSLLTVGRSTYTVQLYNGLCWGSSGEGCSVLNPNVAYFWDQMLTGTW